MFAIIVLTLATLSIAHPQVRGVANVVSHCAQPNTAALTFDDGPYLWMDKIADILDANGAKGTFFINGQNYGCIYSDDNVARVKRTFEKGHQIASHTWSHAYLNSLSKDQVISEFTRTQAAIEKITGAKPSFTRPPYGEYNDIVEDAAVAQGQTLVLWDIDSGDSDGASVEAMKNVYGDLSARRPGSILALYHETRQETVDDVLSPTITNLKNAGYKLVTVAECLGLQPYAQVGSAGQRDTSWTC